eukprot:scaffold110992_cov66-Phaeocystis_antarctica.AAC.2
MVTRGSGAPTGPPGVGHARAGIDLVDFCTEEGRRSSAIELGAAATTFTLRFVEVASRRGGRATAPRSAAAGGSATSAHGLLGGSGGSDAAGAAAAWLAARFAVRRWRAFSVAGLAIQGIEGLLTGAPVWLSLVLCSDVPVRGLRRSSSSVRSAPGGESAMDFGCTLMFMQPNSNSNSP